MPIATPSVCDPPLKCAHGRRRVGCRALLVRTLQATSSFQMHYPIYHPLISHYIIYIIHIFIWGLFKTMVPQNCPCAALSRPFRGPSRIGTRNYDHVFVCIFRINMLYSDLNILFAEGPRPMEDVAFLSQLRADQGPPASTREGLNTAGATDLDMHI